MGKMIIFAGWINIFREMKTLRFLIIPFLFVGILILGYVLYRNFFKIGPQSSLIQNETPRPIVSPTPAPSNIPYVSGVNVYFSHDLVKNGKTYQIKGNFAVFDNSQKSVNGVYYSWVIGILEPNSVLTKIWLTEGQYELISSVVWSYKNTQTPVIFTINPNFSVSLEKNTNLN